MILFIGRQFLRIIGLQIALLAFATLVLAGETKENQPPLYHTRVNSKPGLTLHKDMYILPVSCADDYHNRQTEIVFQISAKKNVFVPGLYFAYTQKSFWQAYDYRNSSPFRETNFNPEIFYRFRPGILTYEHLGLDIGFEHESNGRIAPESRSWNRVYCAPFYLNAGTVIYAKGWVRVPEDDKPYPGSAEGDDNPDIVDYMGYGEIHGYQTLYENHVIHGMVRYNTSRHRGALGINYCFNIPRIASSFIVSFFSGYGESLIDYDKSVTRIGAGFYFNL